MAAPITADEVRALLDQIIDPCSCNAGAPAGLDTMGLVRSVRVAPADAGSVEVEVVLGLTEPGCLMGWAFLREAQERLGKEPSVRAATVRLDTKTLWTPALLESQYRARLAERRGVRLRELRPPAGSPAIAPVARGCRS